MKKTALLLAFFLGFAQSSFSQKENWTSLFDGKTLKGWEGDLNYWRVEDGSIVGEITADKLLKSNTFIIWRAGETKDFELKLEYKMSIDGNSGINYRSEQITEVPFALKGYQADIDGKNRYTGQNYEERGRTTLAYRGQKTTYGQWLYLNVWIDLFSRSVVGWKVDTHMEESLVVDSLKQAVHKRSPDKGLIIHSDRGGQYAGAGFKKVLETHNCIQSMSGADNPYDNAIALRRRATSLRTLY